MVSARAQRSLATVLISAILLFTTLNVLNTDNNNRYDPSSLLPDGSFVEVYGDTDFDHDLKLWWDWPDLCIRIQHDTLHICTYHKSKDVISQQLM